MLARNGNVVAFEHFDNPGRSARQRRIELRAHAEYEATEVGGVQTISILRGVHELEHRILIETGGQRQLNDVTGESRCLPAT